MTEERRRALTVTAVLGVGVVFAVLAADAWNPGISPAIVAADVAVGTLFVAAGAAVLWRRPESAPAAWLMAACGLAWFAGTIWPVLELLHRGFLVHLFATSPRSSLVPRTGGTRGWLVASAVVAAYVASVTGIGGADGTGLVFGGALAIVAIEALVPPRGRTWRARWTEAALAGAIGVLAFAAVLARQTGAPLPGSPFLYDAVLAGSALLLALDLLTARRAAGLLTRAVVDLGDAAHAGTVRDRVARAIGDPTLVVGFAVEAEPGSWVDEAGRPLHRPAADATRSVTPMVVDGREVGFVAHDPVVLADPRSVAAISATAELAMANTALQADIQERVVEVDASRERLVRAADNQRRHLEERLRAGAIRRIGRVEELLRGTDASGSGDADLATIITELGNARSELADFARGVHPAALVNGGLAAALRELVERTPVRVDVTVDADRAEPATESTAYFVCSEAIANAIKHAHATRIAVAVGGRDGTLVVTVQDDGTGGAALGPRGGLRGLADRVEALGGALDVGRAHGGGTSIVARLPARAPVGAAR